MTKLTKGSNSKRAVTTKITLKYLPENKALKIVEMFDSEENYFKHFNYAGGWILI